MFDDNKFRKRLIELRMQKNISARNMSLSLGQSEGYINKIESGYSLPSLSGFFYICEFLEVTPYEFFNYYIKDNDKIQKILNILFSLSPRQLDYFFEILNDIKKD